MSAAATEFESGKQTGTETAKRGPCEVLRSGSGPKDGYPGLSGHLPLKNDPGAISGGGAGAPVLESSLAVGLHALELRWRAGLRLNSERDFCSVLMGAMAGSGARPETVFRFCSDEFSAAVLCYGVDGIGGVQPSNLRKS